MNILPLPRSIRGKIISSLLCIYFLGSAAAVVALFALPFMESKVRLIESFDTLNQTLLEIRRFEKNYLLYGNDEDLMHALDYLDRLRSSLALLEGRHAYSLTTVAEKLPLVTKGGTQKECPDFVEHLHHQQRRGLGIEPLPDRATFGVLVGV